MEALEEFLKDKFEVSKIARFHLSLMDCVITRHVDGWINLSQKEKLEEINPKVQRDAVLDQKVQPATEKQATLY